MKTKGLVLSVVGFGCVGLFFASVSLAGDGAEKVELCHVPPGNPANAHTIVVGAKAAEKHLKNHPGDYLGACVSGCQSASDCQDGDLCTDDICLADGTCDNPPFGAENCNDGNSCTQDSCDPAQGCVNIGVVGQKPVTTATIVRAATYATPTAGARERAYPDAASRVPNATTTTCVAWIPAKATVASTHQ